MPHRRRKPELSEDRALEVKEVLEACRLAANLMRETCERRTVLFRELRDEGWKVNALAKLAGVTPQRMSKILDPEVTPRGPSGPRVPRGPERRSDPWDGWV